MLFSVAARHDNTVVKVRKKSHTQPEIYQLAGSQAKEIHASREDFISIDADKPVSVLQYLVTHVAQGNCNAECGSSLLFVPPMEQREHQYLFSSGDTAAGKQTVNLVIATPIREGVKLNGMDLLSYINTTYPISTPTPSWSTIEKSNASYSAIQFLVEEGLYKITHNSSKAEFSATLTDHHPSAVIPRDSKGLSTASLSFETTTSDAKSFNIIQDKYFSGYGAIPTAKVEKSKSNDEINNAYLAESETKTGEEKKISHSAIAMIVTLCTAVLLVIICIVGFIFAEFAFHNGERSLFQSARVSPYEPIEPN